jgi:hypothetical protein
MKPNEGRKNKKADNELTQLPSHVSVTASPQASPLQANRAKSSLIKELFLCSPSASIRVHPRSIPGSIATRRTPRFCG